MVIRIEAPAKINLFLSVGARRPDGYHDVDTVLQTVSLKDTVEMQPAEGLSVVLEPDLGVPPRENLAWRAAESLGRALHREPRVAIRIVKRIPAGAGLGGGSSDAAAVIAGLAHLWGIDGDDPRLTEVALAIGADVPFFLNGGTALYGGRGDALVCDLPTAFMHVVLAKPAVGMPTAAAYAAFDRLPPSEPRSTDAILAACESGDARTIASAVYNNMTDASAGLVEGIRDALALMRAADGVMAAEMAGSGSAVFALCEDLSSAVGLASAARDAGLWASAVMTTDVGVTILDVEEGA